MKPFRNNHEAFAYYQKKREELLGMQNYTRVQELRADNGGFLENYIRELQTRIAKMNMTIAKKDKLMKRLKKNRQTIEVQYTDVLGQRHTESFIALSKVHKVEKP